MENKKQHIEIADIFRSQANVFEHNYKLTSEQHKAFKAIIQCRTAALGGHEDKCDHCGYIRPSYNSCRNRHCPKCQFTKQAQWVDKLAANLPPVKHFHIIFTIPACLHNLFYLNQDKAYNLLFKAAGKTLLQCASNQKYLGAQVGAVAILHTWGQTLIYHPHIHMIVPAGGLSEDQMEWLPSGKKFFLPVKILSAVFRGILCRLLQQTITSGDLKLPPLMNDFQSLKTQCYKKAWVVYCEKPFSCVTNLIQYLGNYTHRIAISNSRIIDHTCGKVSFWYKDYRSGGLRRQISLNDNEFIRRFLQHVLPSCFYKVRYFGFMAMCNSKSKLNQCFDLIGKTSFLPVLEGLSVLQVWQTITKRDPLRCPKCDAGIMRQQQVLYATGFNPG